MKVTVRYFITHFQPTYTGAGKSLEKLVGSFDKNIFEIEVLTAYRKGCERREIKDGYKVIRVGGDFYGRDGFLTSFGKLYFSVCSAVYNLCNTRFDVLSFIGVGSVALPSILVAKILKKRIVNKITAVGDDDPLKLSQSFVGRFILILLEKGASHWVISKEIYDICLNYSSWNESSLNLITNAVNVKYKNYEDLVLHRTKKKLINMCNMLFVGKLEKRKGVDILLKLWMKNNIDANLILCGPKGDDTDINSMLDEVDQENIQILGLLDFDRLEEEYLKADYFVFPSRREGLPNVVLESMSFGVPVIANHISGVTDFLLGDQNERGILIKNNNIDEWVRNLKTLIEKKSEYDLGKMSINAHKWILRNSETSVVRDKITNMLIGEQFDSNQ